MRWFRFLNITASLLLGSSIALGQGRALASQGFDVASIKPSATTDGRALLQATPGRLVMTNLSLKRLILIAYEVQDYQLAGAPGWIESEFYDVQAKAASNPSVQQMEGPMLRGLLEERFLLTLHRETRQLPTYVLSLAKGGSKFQPSKEGSCVPYNTDLPPPPARPGEPAPHFCGLHPAIAGINRSLEGEGVTMAGLATTLSRAYTAALGRNVVDGTGLTGVFDIKLAWAMTPSAAAPGASANAAPADLIGPSIFAALQEQLGLRLESGKGPVEVLVIDHVEKASGN